MEILGGGRGRDVRVVTVTIHARAERARGQSLVALTLLFAAGEAGLVRFGNIAILHPARAIVHGHDVARYSCRCSEEGAGAVRRECDHRAGFSDVRRICLDSVPSRAH